MYTYMYNIHIFWNPKHYLLSTPALGDPNDPKRLTPETKTPEKKKTKLIWVVGVPLKGSFKGFKGDYEGHYKSLV